MMVDETSSLLFLNNSDNRRKRHKTRAHNSMVEPQRRYFRLFPNLSEDLKLNVLSYVADAPLESSFGNSNYKQSSLTHTLPLVSRKFREYSKADVYWKQAMVRQLDSEPFLWRAGLLQLGRLSEQDDRVKKASSTSNANIALVELVHSQLENNPLYKTLYAEVVSRHLRFKGGMFIMRGNVQLGEPYALHLFEPRYRLLIAEIMRTQSDSARRGGRVSPDVQFIHANRGPLAPTTPAVLVQVQRCEMYADGRADVVLMPVSHVWLEKLWVRPNSGNLYCAQCLRMTLNKTHEMNNLARQEALAHVMDALTGHVAAQDDMNDDEEDEQEESDGGLEE
jgi:Lon protease-like protein